MFSNSIAQIDFQPSSGHITYNRWMGHNFEVKGEVIGERKVTVRRHNAVVTEYLVRPAAGVTNLSRHIVDESNVVKLEPVCQRCNGIGFIGIRKGDDDQQCPVCGDSGEVTF